MQTRVGKNSIFSTEGEKTRKAKCAFIAAQPFQAHLKAYLGCAPTSCIVIQSEYMIPCARVNPLTISTASAFDYPTVETIV